MKNNKAPGEDGIQGELLKYAPEDVNLILCNIYNDMFETHKDEINMGKSDLLAIPKPNKEKGPIKNLRPINLLNCGRKVFSLITLNRIQPKVENFLSSSQAAYRPKRSTGDIVWAHKFIIGKVQMFRDIKVYITGIDMSSAFDTINRSKLMAAMEEFISEDEYRMVRLLLSNTTIRIQCTEGKDEHLPTNVGSPQGDAISGTFFNIAFEKSLRKIRSLLNEKHPEIEHSYSKEISRPPSEMIYADDSDFATESENEKDYLISFVKDTLAIDGLMVNEDKTEKTMIFRSSEKEEETWRTTKKLGSLLGCYEDMQRRIQLSYSGFNSIQKVWKHQRISPQKKLQLYKTIVKPILLYNSGTWGLTKKQWKEIDVVHRRQLRLVLNNKRINNKKLYEKCNEEPVSQTAKLNKWKLFGHILRLPIDTPSNKSMIYFFENKNMKKFSGNPRTTLPVTIDKDLNLAHKNNPNLTLTNFRNLDDLKRLRALAQDRNQWRDFIECICFA